MYLHESIFISPQNTFPEVDLDTIVQDQQNKLKVKEPPYEGVPTSILRRMGRAVRYGVGCALPLFDLKKDIHGIIIGTGHGGMEDCIKFLNQIIEYEEGTLTPTNFVQSTPNAIASQLGMMSTNTGHNSTHVHGGLCFEGAMLETMMLLKEFPHNTYLLGGVEEISTYQYNIEKLGGWHKKENCNNTELYDSGTEGSIAGEGAAMFLVNNTMEDAITEVVDLLVFETSDIEIVENRIQEFIEKNLLSQNTLLISGENGDIRFQPFYNQMEEILSKNPVIRYKHLTGEYSSATSAALWFCTHLFKTDSLPEHMIKKGVISNTSEALVYNCHKGSQHSLILLRKSE